MDIISLKFVILTLISAFIYQFLNNRLKIIFLAILGCAFVATFHYRLLIYILIYSGINYYIGIQIPQSENKKLIYRIGLIFNLSQLILLKYASFAIDPIIEAFGGNMHITHLAEFIIPIGISYFTLQGIGYLFNIKMGWEKPEPDFLKFLIYINFFPKFLSGPIERSNHFLPQIRQLKAFQTEQFESGLRTILFGFFKKIAIANQLAPFIYSTYSQVDIMDGYSLFLLIFLLPVYLYFDFSGYTDIAIGTAKLFGIDLLPNFNRPFMSENMTMFWKRFHISLSAWFNDYIFKQTSFRRRKWGVYASVYAVVLTWVLFGIWHGAGWNFMLLGVLQAIAIIYEFFTRKWRTKIFSHVNVHVRKWIGRIITYVFYGTSLVFFFSPDLKSTLMVFANLFSFNSNVSVVLVGFIQQVSLSVFVFMFIVLALELIKEDFNTLSKRVEEFWQSNMIKGRLFRWTIYSIILSVLFVLGNNVQQFIYSQF